MSLRFPGRARMRRFLEQVVPPRLRFLLFRMVAFVLPSQVGPGGFLQLASQLDEAGLTREAMLCWRIVHAMAPTDGRVLKKRVSLALRAGDLTEVDLAVADLVDGAGITPQHLVRLAGQLAQYGYMESAGRVLVRLSDIPGANRHIAQSPSIVSGGIPGDIRALGEAIASASALSSHLLPLARLCFTFDNLTVAAELFAKSSSLNSLEALDRTAMLHSLAKSNPSALAEVGPEFRVLLGQLSNNADALGMLAKPALVAGEMAIANEAVRQALHLRYGECDPGVVADCTAILDLLESLRGVDVTLPACLLERVTPENEGVPKVFLCGFGWSGSGALYDEVRGVPGFCEFEGAGLNAIINDDAESEATFVQGFGGLGDLWLGATERQRISWHSLWNTFALHVAGLAPTGYSQYKSSAAACNHIRRYGASYTRPFRVLLEDYAALRRDPKPGALHACLLAATESLCSMLVRKSGARVVLFNNAIFGRNAAMLEIFNSLRAAIVYRDPRDVYVDRRKNDLNHWRSPAQMAAFYAHGLRRYTNYKVNCGRRARNLREVPFEKFVEDDAFRARVRAWLLDRLVEESGGSNFDPETSRRNVGIYVGELEPIERAQLQVALDDCHTLDGLSAAAWECDK